MAKRYGEHPPWHDVQLRLRGPVVGALDITFRERWNDPAPLDQHADLVDRGQAARRRPERRPAAAAAARPAGLRAARRPGAADLSGDARRYGFAPHGERSIARGYTKAIKRARRLIYLEDQYLWSTQVADLFADALRRQPRPAPDRGGAPAPRRGRPVRAAAQPGRPRAGDRAVPAGRPGPGARLRRGEPRGHAGLRARQGLRRRRRLGQRRQRQLQPPVVDPRQRTVLRRAGRHPRRPDAAGSGRARRRRPGVRARPAAAAAARAPGPRRRRQRGRRPRRPGHGGRGARRRRRRRWTTGSRRPRGPPPPGRLVRTSPNGCLAHPTVGGSRRTGWSTTRTGGRIARGSRAVGDGGQCPASNSMGWW